MRLLPLITLLLLGPPALAEAVTVAVAANFRPAAEHLVAEFEAGSNHRVTLVTASTGVLFSQITHGAPFDVFLSADREAPMRLAEQGAGAGAPFCYARGELTLLGGSIDALSDPANTLAIANPVTAPYGRAAIEVVERSDFSSGSARKTVRANNALQAYQLWRQDTVDLALVPRSLHLEAPALPAAWYTPIDQYALQLARGSDNAAATDFVAFLTRPATRKAITELGYGSCHG